MGRRTLHTAQKKSDAEIASEHKMNEEALQRKIELLKTKVLAVRELRIHPGLDDKTLTSWNAMMVHGFTDAYTTFGDQRFLDAALKMPCLFSKSSIVLMVD